MRAGAGEPPFAFVEGSTSDLSFRARGPSLEAVFSAAAEALLAATLENPESLRGELTRSLVLEEPDLELLLLRFLNELVYLRDAERLLLRPRRLRVSEGALEGAEGARLEAELVGEGVDRERHRFGCEVKAATAHRLRVARTERGWEATVTLDV